MDRILGGDSPNKSPIHHSWWWRMIMQRLVQWILLSFNWNFSSSVSSCCLPITNFHPTPLELRWCVLWRRNSSRSGGAAAAGFARTTTEWVGWQAVRIDCEKGWPSHCSSCSSCCCSSCFRSTPPCVSVSERRVVEGVKVNNLGSYDNILIMAVTLIMFIIFAI